jgi:hypothetical protein
MVNLRDTRLCSTTLSALCFSAFALAGCGGAGGSVVTVPLDGSAVATAAREHAAAGRRLDKRAECNALVRVINAGIVSLEKAPKSESDPTGISDLEAMATSMDKIAAQAGALPLSLPELRKMRDAYQRMARDIAKAEREIAVAAKERDAARRTAAESTLDGAVKQEDPLVDRINEYCQAR